MLSITNSLLIAIFYFFSSEVTNMLKRFIILIAAVVCVYNTTALASRMPHINQKAILQSAPSLNPIALQYAVKGYQWAFVQHKVRKPEVLTVIDFTLPSYKKRLWVINLKNNDVLLNTYTTQGKGSGLVYAKSFSNKVNTDKTSLGVYAAGQPYKGKHGLSLRIKGLEKGINNNAYRRAIVIHPAYYASEKFIKQNKRAGRSWGCFALSPSISSKLIKTIANGSIIFAYAAPEKNDSNLV